MKLNYLTPWVRWLLQLKLKHMTKQAWMLVQAYFAENNVFSLMSLAGWKHHVYVRRISHLSITRDWCDANDGVVWCKAWRYGNSRLLQKHPVVVLCLRRMSVRGDVISYESDISLKSGQRDCKLKPSEVNTFIKSLLENMSNFLV